MLLAELADFVTNHRACGGHCVGRDAAQRPAWRLRNRLIASAVLAVAFAGSAERVCAQPTDVEILSKADAVQLFAMSKRQWEQNVVAAVRAGAATATPPSTTGMVGMTISTPDGRVSTRLDYARGDARPAAVQVVVTHTPSQHREVFTDKLAQELIDTAQRQLAPEFDVMGEMERIQGAVVFFYIITERRPAQSDGLPR